MKKFSINILMSLIASVCMACTVNQGNALRTETQEAKRKATICQVHGLPLEIVLVPVKYGFPLISKEYLEAEKEFPNTASPIEGGCFYNPTQKLGEKAACPKCTELWQKWKKFHGV